MNVRQLTISRRKSQSEGEELERYKDMPLRTCISCRRVTAKHNLVRLVVTPAGFVEIDRTKKKVGRGAYLCPDKNCWKDGLKSKKLERAFKIKLSSDGLKALLQYVEVVNDGNMKREKI